MDAAHLFAERPAREDVLHPRFVRCGECGLVYADPRASFDEASDYYSNQYDRSTALRPPVGAAWEAQVENRRKHLRRVLEGASIPSGSRFLDVGFGDASSLAAASSMGFDADGLELSDRLVDRARNELGLHGATYGDIGTVDLPEGSYDLIYSWHTIEHVLDVNEWLGRVFQALKPGGKVLIGTESSHAVQGKLWNAPFRALRRTPWPPTSADHTYWFSPPNLAELVRRAGFLPERSHVYENGPIEILRGTKMRGVGRRAQAASLLYVLSGALSRLHADWGGKQILIARRPSTASRPIAQP